MILDMVEQDLKSIQGSKIERKHGTLSTLQDNDQIWNGYLSHKKQGLTLENANVRVGLKQ